MSLSRVHAKFVECFVVLLNHYTFFSLDRGLGESMAQTWQNALWLVFDFVVSWQFVCPFLLLPNLHCVTFCLRSFLLSHLMVCAFAFCFCLLIKVSWARFFMYSLAGPQVPKTCIHSHAKNLWIFGFSLIICYLCTRCHFFYLIGWLVGWFGWSDDRGLFTFAWMLLVARNGEKQWVEPILARLQASLEILPRPISPLRVDAREYGNSSTGVLVGTW